MDFLKYILINYLLILYHYHVITHFLLYIYYLNQYFQVIFKILVFYMFME